MKQKPHWKQKRSKIQTESDMDKEIMKAVKPLIKLGFVWCFKIPKPKYKSESGFPDRLLFIKSPKQLYLLMIEEKSPQGTGRLELKQKEFMEFMKTASRADNIIYLITNSAKKITDSIKQIIEGKHDLSAV